MSLTYAQFAKGSTNATVYVYIEDTRESYPNPLTGLVYNTSGLTCYYVKSQAASAQLSLATQTAAGAHTDGGFVEVDSTNCPGLYRLDLSDTMLATVDHTMVVLRGAANMSQVVFELQLTTFDLNDATATDDATAISGSTVAADNLEDMVTKAMTFSAFKATASTTSGKTDLSETTLDHYNRMLIQMLSGDSKGECRVIADYLGGLGEAACTFDAALVTDPDLDDFLIAGYSPP